MTGRVSGGDRIPAGRSCLTRRLWLGGAISVGATGAAGCASLAAGADDRFEAVCRDLYVYGFPVLEMARARQRTIGPAANRWRHVRRLADAASRAVTTPNNDTLYSSAWLDLRSGPVELAYPEAGVRYQSIAVLDLYSNNFIVMGPRQTQGLAGRIRLAAPDDARDSGALRAPTPWVWAQVRTLVAGIEDLPSAHRLQDGLQITAKPQPPPGPLPEAADPFDELCAIASLLETEAPPLPREARLRAEWRRAGVTPEGLSASGASLRTRAVRGVEAARALIAGRLDRSRPVSGWIYPEPGLGDFGRDYLYRASIATWGLGALPVREAAYFRAVAADGRTTFAADRPHVLRFGAGASPPAGAFWSLSLYEALEDGRLFFAPNLLGRHAIGDRTPGLLTGPDGSLTIWIAGADPGGDRRANWLPAAGSRFALVLRAYNPDPVMFDGRYRLPRIEEVS